ncbi:ABC transporter ATP-binding protein [Desulfosporosinus metallidurans]|uniref:Branched-chain amino acid transport ATP-binding protein LivF n=1 Tax=Desulfosporosinus metallidurans TaxID=1888891 RepID=A0A1Q8QZ57_9FIRM|nr:ABC transporter ATP-binding protein [Desulfosporosinus metallidurans]OLN32658.1 Branched-chain amino acid transport ATP-binding protein LivF [Desulfosporosinus metallidurans]
MSLLKCKSVESGYGKIPILHGVELRVEESEMVAVLGPNGAGKSTLMKTIAGILPLMKGQILFKEEDISPLKHHALASRGLGYVPQEKNVFADLTVAENLELGAFTIKNPKEAIETIYHRFPKLKERCKQKAGTLSGGERQLLAVGSALLLNPRLLILDEPTSGLSPQATETMINLISKIRDDGTAVIWVVEESPKEVLAHVDRVYLLESGLVRKEGSGEGFLEDEEEFERLFLGHNVS